MSNNILSEDKKYIRILNKGNIEIDTNLPKYKIIKEEEKTNNVSILDYNTLSKFFTNDNGNTTKFNISISSNMRNVVRKTRNENLGDFFVRQQNFSITTNNTDKKKESNEEYFDFDVIKFFSDVKVEKENAKKTYRNRITELIKCIGYTEQTGQIALKEKLFESLVINKYESILYANGYYQVLTEAKLVELVQKAPKKLKLDYIKHYTRNIPFDVITKKIEMDKLEVFDNYVILHYDAEDNATEKTNEEKQREIERAKDPILFGVIAGSNKLYYVADWIDEYCDLQFETVVDIIGKEIIERDFLKEKIN